MMSCVKKRIAFTILIFLLMLHASMVYGETVSLNSAGILNRPLSIDPAGRTDGFSAVLYSNANGLPTSEANAITETGDGFIWIGSYAGLIRYDGNTFTRIDDDTGISNVRALYTDSRDRLWIGTNDAGFLVMENGRFRRWGKADGLPSSVIRNFAEDEEGCIYIGTTSGVVIMDPGLNLTVAESDELAGAIQDLRRGPDGLVYAATREGTLAGFSKGELVSLFHIEGSSVSNISCFLPDPDNPGWFWLGGTGSSVYYGEAANGFQDPEVLDLGELTDPERLELIDGRIWVCARNGIGRLDESGICVLENIPMDNSLQHVMTDYQGNLWFTSSRQGVMKVVPNQFADLYARWKRSPEVVNSTCLYDSMLFLATDEGLVAMRDGEEVESIPLTKAVTASGIDLGATDLLGYLGKTRIRSVMRDSKGGLWISPWNGQGLVRYAGGEMTRFTPEDGMASEKCRAIHECEDGTILVAQSGGLSVIREGRVTATYGKDEGVTNEGVLTVTEGFGGEYILGTDGGGIFIIQDGKATHIGTEDGLGSDVVMRVSRSRTENVVWIVTGNSLAYLTADHKITTIQGFPYANNYDLYENDKGDLWVLSSSGIYVAPVKQLLANDAIEAEYYSIHNGLPYIATANSYSELTEDGDLYIAGSGGVAKVNINTPFMAGSKLKMAVPFVEAGGVRVWPDDAGGFTIPSGTRKLVIYPYILSFGMDNPTVSYQLQGFDDAPVETKRKSLSPVTYTDLAGGCYTFILKEGDHEIAITLNKEKALYEQPLFWVVVAALAIMINVWVVRLIMKRQAEKIEKKKDQERIADELRFASELQASELPHVFPAFPDRKEFDLYASMTPAKEVGGDFYDFFLIDDDHLAMVIADVSGKGVSAALFMMVSKALIRNQLMSGCDPALALQRANAQLCENNETQMFVTVWAAVLEISTGKGLACNAGHENPGIRHSDGPFELLVYKHNIFLGASEKVKYVNRTFEMKPGSSLFVYTDGVPEAHDKNKEMFGAERLKAALNLDCDAAPEDLIGHVRSAIDSFVGAAPQFDDITMLAFKYYGTAGQKPVTAAEE